MASGYYVARVERATMQEEPFTRIYCDDGLDAQATLELWQSREPKSVFIVGHKPTKAESESYRHVCRDCNCQFDRRGRITN